MMMMKKMLKYCGVLSSEEGQRGLLRICRRPPHPLSHSNSHLRPESCEKKNLLPHTPLLPIKRPVMTLGMGKEGIGAWITNVDAQKAQPYVLWQAHTSLMHICKFSSSKFYAKILSTYISLLQPRCFALKGEVHGPTHPCHVHSDLG